ncbi:MAG: hypothetical protein QRY74_02130 [Chlamydia sp.]
MFHASLPSILDRIQKAALRKTYPIQIIVATPVQFIKEAIQFSFKNYCRDLHLPFYTQEISADATKIEILESDLFSEKKAVQYTQIQAQRKKGISIESLFSYSGTISSAMLSIFNEDSTDLKKEQFVSFEVISVPDQKPWEMKKIVASWCVWYLDLSTIKIEDSALQQVVEMGMNDFYAIQSQLDLLITYIFEKKRIELSDFYAMSRVEEKANMFQLLDGLLMRSSESVIQEAKAIIEDSSYQTIQVLRFLQSQMRTILKSTFQGAPPPYKGAIFEKRIAAAKKLGYRRLESWIEKILAHETGLRTGAIAEEGGASFILFFCALLSPINSDLY